MHAQGEPDDVRFKRSRLYKVLKAGKGFPLGTAPGQAWHAKRYNIFPNLDLLLNRFRYDLPLLRDFILEIGLWVDVCESATPFPHVIPLWKSVKQAIHTAFAKHNAPGWAGCHISHTYRNGVCLYFHFASLAEQDFAVYLAAKAGATEAILRNKGALVRSC